MFLLKFLKVLQKCDKVDRRIIDSYIFGDYKYKERNGLLMKEKIMAIEKQAEEEINACNLANELNELKVKYLGKKCELTRNFKKYGNFAKRRKTCNW